MLNLALVLVAVSFKQISENKSEGKGQDFGIMTDPVSVYHPYIVRVVLASPI